MSEEEEIPEQDVEQDVAPDDEQAAPSAEEPATSEDSPDTGADKPKGVQKRIDELTANWRTTERDRDYWRELALKGTQAPQETPQSVDRPKVDDFESYDDYIDALTDYKVNQRAEQWQEQTAQQREHQLAEQRQADFRQRATEFMSDHPDFWDVAGNPSVPISQPVVDAAMESDMGPQVLYHLGSHPQEAAKLSQMSPTAAAREIGRLEARLQMPPKPKTSQAPEPLDAVSGGGESATRDPEKMTTEQFMAWRRKQLKR